MAKAISTDPVGMHSPHGRLPSSARIGKVCLAVSNLDRSVRFYHDVIGLAVLGITSRDVPRANLSLPNGNVLLELQELGGVKPIRGEKRIGLYHTAFLLPTREALSSFVSQLNRGGVRFGSSDHLVSEALYLVDPDGLTVEVYADRDRSSWTYEGSQIVAGSIPLNFSDLPQVAPDSWQGAPAGTSIGHVHFYTSQLQKAADFYHAAMGFDLVNWSYPGALFVSAGGYHHHVGLNNWNAGSPKASAQDARLLSWELLLPDQNEVDVVSERIRNVASELDENDKTMPSYTDSDGMRVVLRTDSAMLFDR